MSYFGRNFYGDNPAYSMGASHLDIINQTNYNYRVHNELMDEQVKQNNSDLKNLETQTNIQTATAEVRKLASTGMSGLSIKGIKDEYDKMLADAEELKTMFLGEGQGVTKDSLKPIKEGGEQEAKFFLSAEEKQQLKSGTGSEIQVQNEGTQMGQRPESTAKFKAHADHERGKKTFRLQFLGDTTGEGTNLREDYFTKSGKVNVDAPRTEAPEFDTTAKVRQREAKARASATRPRREAVAEQRIVDPLRKPVENYRFGKPAQDPLDPTSRDYQNQLENKRRIRQADNLRIGADQQGGGNNVTRALLRDSDRSSKTFVTQSQYRDGRLMPETREVVVPDNIAPRQYERAGGRRVSGIDYIVTKEFKGKLPPAPKQTKIRTFDAPQRPFTKPLMEQTSFDKVLSEPKGQAKKIDRTSFSSSFSGHNADYLDFDYDTAKGRAEIGGSRPDNYSNVRTDQGTTRKYFRAPKNLAQGDRNKQYLVERIKGTNDYNLDNPRKFVVGKDGKQYDYMSKSEFTRKPVLQGLASDLYHSDGAMNPQMIPPNVDVPTLELQGDVSVRGSTTSVNPQSNPPTYTHGTPQGDIRGQMPKPIQKLFGWDKNPEAVGSNVYNANNPANPNNIPANAKSGMGFADRVKYFSGRAGQQIKSVVGETGRQVVSKGIKYAGIGATLVGSGLATAELIQGKWDEMNLAQKIANVGIQAGGGFEIAGLMSMNPYLQAFGGLISLASGVAGAIGEYQAGEKQKEDAKIQTETLNKEAQDLKQDNVSATAYGRQTTTGRFDATKGIGVASF